MELEVLARVSPESWTAAHLAGLVAADLQRLGLDAWAHTTRGVDPEPSGRGFARLEVRTQDEDDPQGPVDVEVRLSEGKSIALRGKASELDRLSAELALAVARAVGRPPAPSAAQLLGQDPFPQPVHQLLGKAEVDLVAGDTVRARMRFDRAQELWRGQALPQAFWGAWAAQQRPTPRGTAPDEERAELARAALERAEAAVRARDRTQAQNAFGAYLRYNNDVARRWWSPVALEARSTVLVPGDTTFWLTRADGATMVLDARSGVQQRASLPGRLLAVMESDLLVLDGGWLKRLDGSLGQRWRLRLPFTPRVKGAISTAGGFAPLAGEGRLAWVDLGVGALGQQAHEVEVLATDVDGALVTRNRRKELALLRPGRKTAAWKQPLSAPLAEAHLVRGRVILLRPGALEILDAINGKRRGEVITLAAGARWLGGGGRYGVLAFADDHVEIFDVLASARTASIAGPGLPLSAASVADGVAVAFSGGDVIAYDRDGLMLDRALVPGGVFLLTPGSAVAPGVIAFSPRGALALGEPPRPERPREVEVLLRMAELLRKDGDPRGALRLAEWVARQSAGGVAEAEVLRTQLLEESKVPSVRAAARAAKQRALAAKNPRRPLPRFQIAG